MNFKVKNLPEVEEDVKYALSYYSKINNKLPAQFLDRLEEIKILLSTNPFFEIKYNDVRAISIKQFPYLTHFIINEKLNEVIILAIAYSKENPTNYDSRLSE